MKIIISPAKTLNFKRINFKKFTTPSFFNSSELIIRELRKLAPDEIEKKLKVNKKLALLNYERYKNWKFEDKNNSKQAIFTYNGYLFKNIETNTLKEIELDYLQDNLFIISTLYGLLKPFDLIMPYRLDFLAKIKINNKTLYDFWKTDIVNYLNKLDDEIIINLASTEYSKLINRKKLNKKIINIVFKEFKNGKYKTTSMNAKKMRGKFLNFMAKESIINLELLKKFNYDNYKFSEKESNDNCFTFLKN